MKDLFEYATRNKLRFTHRGQVSTEDLWDLNLEQLNGVYMNLQKQKKDNSGTLIVEETDADALLDIQTSIVRHVFNAKKADIEAKEQRLIRREKKRQLQDLLVRKQEEGLSNLSEEELRAMIDSM